MQYTEGGGELRGNAALAACNRGRVIEILMAAQGCARHECSTP